MKLHLSTTKESAYMCMELQIICKIDWQSGYFYEFYMNIFRSKSQIFLRGFTERVQPQEDRDNTLLRGTCILCVYKYNLIISKTTFYRYMPKQCCCELVTKIL